MTLRISSKAYRRKKCIFTYPKLGGGGEGDLLCEGGVLERDLELLLLRFEDLEDRLLLGLRDLDLLSLSL